MTFNPYWCRHVPDEPCFYCLPDELVGNAGKVVVVNGSATGYELVDSTDGTVTSVGVSGSDGLEVDSGSPVTSAGTIALGVNASGLRSHINVENGADVTDTANVVSSLSGAALTGVTVVSGDKVLIQDISNGDALRTVTAQSIANLVTAPSGTYIHRGINVGSDTAAGGVTTSYATYATVTASSLGGLVIIEVSGLFQNAGSGAQRTYDYRVQCDGATVGSAVTGTILGFTATQTLASTSVDAFSHTPTAASHTWTFQALASAASSVTLRRPKIKVYEVA